MLRKNWIHWFFSIIYLLSALLTVIPKESASKVCRLGYKALCSFTPYGTIILLGLFALHVILATVNIRKLQRMEENA